MIDWAASGISQESARNKDHVITICEGCGKSRSVLYIVAKRRQQHLCMSCIKKHGEYSEGEIVEYKCIDCGATKEQPYSKKRWTDWRCHRCAMVQGHKDGKFKVVHNSPSESGKLRISESAKKHWEDPEYRTKWSESRSKSKQKRSGISKAIWSDEDRLKKLSASIKSVWADPDYRLLKSQQSAELWHNEEYISKQAAGMAEEDVRDRISAAVILCWQDPEYRAKILSRETSDELRKRLSEATTAINTARWHDPEFRAKLMSVFGSDEFRSKMSDINKEISNRPEVRSKLSKLMSDKWKEQDYRETMAKHRAEQLGRVSSIQQKLYDYLDDLGVGYHKEGPDTRVGYYVFDCLIPGKNILIECQGDYWHSLARAQQNDRSKFTYVNRYFPEYEILYIWEHEFYCKDRVLDRLKLKLGIDIQTAEFDFKDVVIAPIDHKLAAEFLDSYHYIGKGRGGHYFGAMLHGELIGCVIFSDPIRQNISQQFGVGKVLELSRLCIHPNYHRKNFGSWLIGRSLRLLPKCTVVAYADATVGHSGIVYRASGFTLHHTVPADYWYVDKDGYVMHKKTLYNRACKMSMTEQQFADTNGYLKKYGGHKYCYIRCL